MSARVRRRTFFKLTGALALGHAMGGLADSLCSAGEAAGRAGLEKLGWSLCAQLYTFRHLPFYEALEKIASLGFRHVEPCFFLGLDRKRPQLKTNEDLGPAERRELRRRLADCGIAMTNYYAQLGTDQGAARKTFEFAKEMGTKTIVAEPPAEAFDMLEKLCDEYGINLAVHNHPRRPTSKYWRPENVLAVCRGRSRRIGACCDTGHWVRSALKPVDCLKKMEGRIITMHLKDVAEWGKPEARDVPLGTGLADCAGILRELRRQGFRGLLSIEYEHQSPQLMDEVAQCMAFVRKTAASL